MADEFPNPLLADSVVRGRIDQVDPTVQHSVQNLFGVLILHDSLAPRVWPTQPHAAVAELGDGLVRFSEGTLSHCLSNIGCLNRTCVGWLVPPGIEQVS